MNDEVITRLRVAVIEAEGALHRAIKKACPGKHKLVQHRDKQPPWCPHCGRDARGYARPIKKE